MRAMIWLVLAATFGLVRAQDVPPPPKPAGGGPSLEATMKFIQERLGAVGALNYIAYLHDNKVGNDWTNSFRTEASNLRANPSSCRIDYHVYSRRDDTVARDVDLWFSLKDVREIKVQTREQDLKESAAKDGHPEWTFRLDPPVFVLKVEMSDSRVFSFPLSDESVANRVAQALVHSVELCGGGNKDPF